MSEKNTVQHHESDVGSEAEKNIRGDAFQSDLNNNASARIKNPLMGLSPRQLTDDVREFAQQHQLEHIIPLLTKGAFVAQSPTEFESVEGIDEAEKVVLREEVTRKWRHPKALYFTVILCSIGAAVQGWDQTGSNGANLSWPVAFDIDDTDPTNPHYERNLWLVGFVNAAPYIAASLMGCWMSDPLNLYFGRRGTIFFSSIFCIVPVFGSALSQNWYELFITRMLLGIGMGTKASTIPIYAAENSPPSIRGALVMTWQMWTAFGIFLGLSANLAVVNTGDIAWRLQLGSAFIPAVPLLIGIYFCPESPRWLIKKGRYHDAYKSLVRLRNHPIQAARDLYYINAQLSVEASLQGPGNYVTRFVELFTVPRVRRATLASFTVMIAQQMCGINIIAFYSSTVFVSAGASNLNALLASWGFGAVNFIFAAPALWTIDTFGRRSLLLFTFPQMAWTLLAAGFAFKIPADNPAHLGIVAFFIFLFAAFYSPGEGPVPFTYSAEVHRLRNREQGMAFAVATCLFWASVLAMTWPKIVATFGTTGAFGFYAGLNVIAFFMIFLFVPETKQRTLEELDYVFAIPVRTHVHYNTSKALPYFFRRWLLCDKRATLEPLYQFDNDHNDGAPRRAD